MTRILVIDDDDQLRQMLRRMLEYTGYEVVEAADGAQGLKVFHEEPTDLVITDILMPGQEGIETIILLRRDYPDVPVIAISGGGTISANAHLNTAGKLGADRTLSKPFTRDEILSAVSDLLGSN